MTDVEIWYRFLDASSRADASQRGRGDLMDMARALPLGTLRAPNASSGIWARCSGDVRDISINLREVALVSGKADQATLAAVYFALLASDECPVVELFDTFCFTVCWQGLRNNCLVGHVPVAHDSAGTDEDEPEAADTGIGNLPAVVTALSAAGIACSRSGLAGKPEALFSCVEQCSGIVRLALSYQSKSKKQEDDVSKIMATIAGRAEEVLRAVLVQRNLLDADNAVQILSCLRPGLYGCVDIPRPADPVKPNPKVRDATVRIFQGLSDPLHGSVLAVLEDATIRAADRAPIRNMVAEATSTVAGGLSASQRTSWLNFLALLLHHPHAAMRLLALQTMEPLLMELLAKSHEDFCKGEDEAAQAQNAQLPCAPASFVAALLVQRCADRHSSVSSRAMAGLSKCLGELLSRDRSHEATLQWLRCLTHALCHSNCLRFAAERLHTDVSVGGAPQAPEAEASAPTPGAERSAQPTPCPNTASTSDQTPAAPTPQQPPSSAATAMSTPAGAGPTATSAVSCYFEWQEVPPGPSTLLPLLRSQAADTKASVRKGSIQLTTALVLLLRAADAPDDLLADTMCSCATVLRSLSTDGMLSVRKAAVDAAAELVVAVPLDNEAAFVWAGVTLPLLQDAESSVQEAVLAEMWKNLLSPMLQLRLDSSDQAEVAKILRCRIRAISSAVVTLQPCLQMICTGLKAKLQPGPLCTSLQCLLQGVPGLEPTTQVERTFVWTLITEITATCSGGVSANFMLDAWRVVSKQLRDNRAPAEAAQAVGLQHEAAAVLRAIAASESVLDDATVANLQNDLYTLAEGCSVGCVLLIPLLRALSLFSLKRNCQPSCCTGKIWQHVLFERCKEYIVHALEEVCSQPEDPFAGFKGAATSAAVHRACVATFTIGHAALEGEVMPEPPILSLVQALTLPTKLKQLSTTLSPKLTPKAVAPLSLPPQLQAHAWAALGKICLVDEALCTATAPLMVTELTKSRQPAVRNNLLLALTDMCMHYTLLVDAHLGKIAACMQDPHPLVRKQAVALMACLLQREFVKWRGPLFVQYLVALVDDSPTVRLMAQTLITDVLSNVPTLAHNHFLEVMFLVNGSAAAWRASRRAGDPQDTLLNVTDFSPVSQASLSGPTEEARGRRFSIYKALLSTMQPQYKFALVARITQDIISAAADGGLPLDRCDNIIGDALGLLGTPEMQIDVKKGLPPADEEVLDDGGAQIANLHGKAAAASHLLRKHALDRIVPAIVALKSTLEEKRHPLQRHALQCLVQLMLEHKDAMEEALAMHRQLTAEIKFALAEQQKAAKAAQHQRQRASASPQRTPALGQAEPRAPALPLATPGFRAGQSLHVTLATNKAAAPAAGAATPGLFAQDGLQQGPTPAFFNPENNGLVGNEVAPSPLSRSPRPPPLQIPTAATASEGTCTGTPGSGAGKHSALLENTVAIRTPKMRRGGRRQRSLLSKV